MKTTSHTKRDAQAGIGMTVKLSPEVAEIVAQLAQVMGRGQAEFVNGYLGEVLAREIEDESVGENLVADFYFDTDIEATMAAARSDRFDDCHRNWTLHECPDGFWMSNDGFCIKASALA